MKVSVEATGDLVERWKGVLLASQDEATAGDNNNKGRIGQSQIPSFRLVFRAKPDSEHGTPFEIYSATAILLSPPDDMEGNTCFAESDGVRFYKSQPSGRDTSYHPSCLGPATQRRQHLFRNVCAQWKSPLAREQRCFKVKRYIRRRNRRSVKFFCGNYGKGREGDVDVPMVSQLKLSTLSMTPAGF